MYTSLLSSNTLNATELLLIERYWIWHWCMPFGIIQCLFCVTITCTMFKIDKSQFGGRGDFKISLPIWLVQFWLRMETDPFLTTEGTKFHFKDGRWRESANAELLQMTVKFDGIWRHAVVSNFRTFFTRINDVVFQKTAIVRNNKSRCWQLLLSSASVKCVSQTELCRSVLMTDEMHNYYK